MVRNIDDAGLDASNLNFVLYPNPAQSVLHINWLNAGNMTIQVRDVCGKLLLSEQKEALGAELNIQRLSAGTYIIQLVSPEGRTIQKQFIKQ